MGQSIYTASERTLIEQKSRPAVALVVRNEADSAALAKIDAASQALAEVRDIWSAKRAIDGTKLLRQFVRAIECSEEVEQNAHALTIEAHRTFGEHWRNAEKNRGAEGIGKCSTDHVQHPPTLAELDVHRNVAAEAVKLADLSDNHPETYAALKSGDITKGRALSVLRPLKEDEPFHVLVDGARFKDSVRALVAKWRGTPSQAAQILGDLSRELEREDRSC